MPVFYGDLVYKFKKLVGKPKLSGQFKKIIKHYKNGYNMDIIQQSACLAVFTKSRSIDVVFSFITCQASDDVNL